MAVAEQVSAWGASAREDEDRDAKCGARIRTPEVSVQLRRRHAKQVNTMNKKRRHIPADVAADLTRELEALGCVYEWSGDNRSHRTSRYIFVRRPLPATFRVADHPSERINKAVVKARGQIFDVGPHAMTVEQALAAYKESLEKKAHG